MYIEPNSTIYLLRNVPLDNTYTDTMWFANASAQWTHFKTRVDTQQGLTFSKQTYQRVNRNAVRLQINADLIWDVNYMMFQNTAYGDKWFYAFVTSIDYINDAVSQINYEIDVMQTWAFDYQLGQCMVEREHAATDVAGDNVMPENFDLGELIPFDTEFDEHAEDMGVLITSNFIPS